MFRDPGDELRVGMCWECAGRTQVVGGARLMSGAAGAPVDPRDAIRIGKEGRFLPTRGHQMMPRAALTPCRPVGIR